MVVAPPWDVPNDGEVKIQVVALDHWFFRTDPVAHGATVDCDALPLVLTHEPKLEAVFQV